MTLVSATFLLLLVLDPIGNIPFFLSALSDVEARRRRIVILRELLVALVVLVGFLFVGQPTLQFLDIDEPALTTAGGIILFLIALKMVFPQMRGGADDQLEGEPFIVPLAIPFIAGPSALATVMLIMSREPGRWPEWLASVLIAWAVTGVVLFGASGLSRFLGQRGLVAIERLMGMVLTAIAVQMIMTGLRLFWGLDPA